MEEESSSDSQESKVKIIEYRLTSVEAESKLMSRLVIKEEPIEVKTLVKEEPMEVKSLVKEEPVEVKTLVKEEPVEDVAKPISQPLTKTLIKQEHEVKNVIDSTPSESGSSNLSWPSLWKNGPRRSAFKPYKPRRETPSTSRSPVVKAKADSTSCIQHTAPRATSTPIMTNLQRGNIESVSTNSNFSWFTLAGRGDVTVELLQDMVAQGKDIDCVDEEGLSGLMWAAFHGQIHTVQILLDMKVMVDRQGMTGETALMLAATEGHVEVVRLLITAGADVNHEDNNRNTALMFAVYGDHPHTVNELLIKGADIFAVNLRNFTAFDIAVDRKAYKSKIVMENIISSLTVGS